MTKKQKLIDAINAGKELKEAAKIAKCSLANAYNVRAAYFGSARIKNNKMQKRSYRRIDAANNTIDLGAPTVGEITISFTGTPKQIRDFLGGNQ